MRRKTAMATSAAILAMVMARGAHAEMVTIEEYIGASIGRQIGDIIVKGDQFKNAKSNANAEFKQARSAFYGQLANGVLGSPEEQNFAELLYDKDIYFLSLNVSEGVRSSKKRLEALDKLSGGAALDGGISGWPADDLFDAWVTAVRSHLGARADGQLIFVFNPVALKQAIDATKPSYDRYRKARDAQEFKRWRASRPLIVEPKADTPEQRADTYIRVVLHDAVEKAVAAVPEAEREPTREKIAPWANQLRQAIVDYEATPITPDVVADALKAWKYSSEDTAYFWQQLGNGKSLQGPAFVSAVVQALSRTGEFQDRKRYGRAYGANPAVIDEQLKEWAQKRASPADAKTMTYLYQHKPVAFGLITYVMVADLISSGHLGHEPPLPVFRRVDGRVVEAPTPVPAPTRPPADAAPANKVASLPPAENPEPHTTTRQPLGLALSSLDTTNRSKFAIKGIMKGVLVTKVDPNSPAANQRMQAGDMIVEINHEAVNDPSEVAARVKAGKEEGRKSALLLVANAQGERRIVVLPLD